MTDFELVTQAADIMGTQKKLSQLLGCSQTTVSNWLHGKSSPNPEQKQVLLDLVSGDLKTWLQSMMCKKQLNGQSLAEKAGVSVQTISHILSGKVKKPQNHTLEAIARALGEEPPALGTGVSQQKIEQTSLASWLQSTMNSKELTATALAAKAGVSAPTIYNMLSGTVKNPQKGTLLKIAEALGVEPPETSEEAKKTEQEMKQLQLGDFIEFGPYVESELPEVAGVYVFYDVSDRPIYIGQSVNIKKRVKDHYEKFWFKPPLVQVGAYIQIDDKKLREQIEKVMIAFLKSNAVLNKVGTG